MRDGEVLSRNVWVREKSHSEFLTPTIENCIQVAGIAASDLDALAVGRGPGSFTGIRIAINAARSLAYALGKPVFAFDTLEILAAGVPESPQPLLVLVNAHKNMLYTSVFHWRAGQWVSDGEPEALTIEKIAQRVQQPHVCIGDGYEEYEPVFPPDLRRNLIRDPAFSDYPLPEVLGRMASQSPPLRSAMDWKELQALYIRASGAEETLEEKKQRDASKTK